MVGEHIGGEADNVDRMETELTQLEMTHELLGGGVGVDGIGVLDIADPCVCGGVDNEVTTAVSVGFIQLEILPQNFVNGLGAVLYNGSGLIGDYQANSSSCWRVKHLVVLRFVGSAGG